MLETVIMTQGLRKQYGKFEAVKGVDLAVGRGEVFGFLGPNGAGKTTTIGMLLGLIHPTAGTVEILGQSITPTQTQNLKRVGALVGAAPALIPYLSAREHLELVARMHPGTARQRIDLLLEQLDLVHAGSRRTDRFSTGMKQRLGLAMAMLYQPEVLILDEPTNGMDPAGMHDVRNLLRSLAGQGTTIFLSSHLLHEVEQVCDRIAVLSKGEIVAQGPVGELMGQQKMIRVRVEQLQEAARILTGAGITQVKTNGLYISIQDVPGEEVSRILASHQLYPSEITSPTSDLESLFLELTQESASTEE